MTSFASTAPLILIADDDKFIRLQLRCLLEKEGYRVEEVDNGIQCLAAYSRLQPDIVLLDAQMPQMNGFDCCAQLQTVPGIAGTPILLITSLEDQQFVDLAFQAGAADYITKPIHLPVLRQRVRRLLQQRAQSQQIAALVKQLEQVNQELQQLAHIDGLTQVANRRRLDAYLVQEWRRQTREQTPLSLILCDIDCFKLYNDTYGHQAGDDCLRAVAAVLSQKAKRPADLVARYGGEEFAIVLPNTPLAGAVALAETIRAAIQTLAIAHARSTTAATVTLSLGVVSLTPPPQSDQIALIAAADQALYEAKAQGRNRVVSVGQGSFICGSCGP